MALSELESSGLQLVERNYRQKFGELDIIMLDAQLLVFVEVRYRASCRWGDGLASITRVKQKKLILAAKSFLKTHPRLAQKNCRFDVVSINGPRAEPRLKWVQGAFE